MFGASSAGAADRCVVLRRNRKFIDQTSTFPASSACLWSMNAAIIDPVCHVNGVDPTARAKRPRSTGTPFIVASIQRGSGFARHARRSALSRDPHQRRESAVQRGMVVRCQWTTIGFEEERRHETRVQPATRDIGGREDARRPRPRPGRFPGADTRAGTRFHATTRRPGRFGPARHVPCSAISFHTIPRGFPPCCVIESWACC